MTNKREQAEARGRRGEAIAAWWLRLQGWRIVAQRLKTPRGEIDLIARRGKTLAFVEVKTRSKGADLSLAIDEWRLRRVAAAAQMLYPRYAKGAEEARIDVMLVAPWRMPVHLANVWHE
jgi:putative endonuclease